MFLHKFILVCMIRMTLWSTVRAETMEQPGGCHALPSLLQSAGSSLTCIAASLINCQGNGNHQLSITQDLRDTMSEVRRAITEAEQQRRRPRHCRDLQRDGDSVSGVRRVYPFRSSPDAAATVYCDQETDGGGWTVFQRRLKLPVREDFYRTWVEYELGFGHLDGGEFWLGLDLLHHLTSTDLQEMRVDLTDYEGLARWAKYGLFHVGDSASKYRINVGRYNGTAGDGLGGGKHSGYAFTTHDQDNDGSGDNCALKYRGGWWYGNCHISNLNGFQYEGKHDTFADGIEWHPWKGYHYSLKTTSMMIRPAF
ncbi:ryncolin-1-like [Penaeus japonicus]|uniref:ryncolin-1-like n=1 Tax=Penaeus japonicus TaxID=27405 RepID=UPI001C714D23|nr:ryncolin-1-like [Penaeus japonicus]XP_042875249.1 ryncolin-1-like [Penaeus japonicus]